MQAAPTFEGDLVIATKWKSRSDSGAAVFTVVASLVYVSPEFGRLVVPDGFKSDLASVPGLAKWYIDDDDPRIIFAAVVHDYVYARLGRMPDGRVFTREQADAILREAMIASGARRYQAQVVYLAVRLGGGSHWNANLPLAA